MEDIRNFTFFLLILFASSLSSCNKSHQKFFDRAESLMETRPDSALMILKLIDKSELSSKQEQARYAILMSMALDKNYIDTTSFDVLQPAIDYYLENGTPDDKLRTYYYQGRIFQNQGDHDNALNSFIKGIDMSDQSHDSLYIARTLVAQGVLYDDLYNFECYTECYLRAAQIYKRLSIRWSEFDCLLNALNGSTASGNKTRGDSILTICDNFTDLDSVQLLRLTRHRLSQALRFNDIPRIKTLINNIESHPDIDSSVILNLSLAHHKVGNDIKAKQLLDCVYNGQNYDTLKFLAISVPILENLGDFENALASYRNFSQIMDSLNTLKFDQKINSVEEKHQLELKVQQDAREKAKIIWGFKGGIIFLIMVVIILLLLFRSNKNQKDLALKRVKISELENNRLKFEKDNALQQAKITKLHNEGLKSEREKLSLENKNLQLERDKKALEAENLSHRVLALENEKESLKVRIQDKEELPIEVQKAIKIRIEMINALMASYITDNEQYEKPYEAWIKELTDNTNEFMNSNRLAFQASHPRFIQYFEDHGLTESEINYVCLYAIGLRGKEVGNYMNKPSHVNTSSAIRKKLGIDKHQTNIGIYVRKLLKEL